MPENINIKLFIADDDSDDREFLIDALVKNGYDGKYVEFSDGDHLCRYLHLHPVDLPDLILLDLNMPVKDGYDTLKQLKSDASFQQIPIMVLTSSSKQEDEQYCYRLGCDYFRRKPSTIDGYSDLANFIVSKAG